MWNENEKFGIDFMCRCDIAIDVHKYDDDVRNWQEYIVEEYIKNAY